MYTILSYFCLILWTENYIIGTIVEIDNLIKCMKSIDILFNALLLSIQGI